MSLRKIENRFINREISLEEAIKLIDSESTEDDYASHVINTNVKNNMSRTEVLSRLGNVSVSKKKNGDYIVVKDSNRVRGLKRLEYIYLYLVKIEYVLKVIIEYGIVKDYYLLKHRNKEYINYLEKVVTKTYTVF